jgi:hypothetical protein
MPPQFDPKRAEVDATAPRGVRTTMSRSEYEATVPGVQPACANRPASPASAHLVEVLQHVLGILVHAVRTGALQFVHAVPA